MVEDCVNAVGVDVNTASAPLLARVSGVGDEPGRNHRRPSRRATAPFRTRAALKEVPRLGAKAFEQCAGFLRIRGGDDPLDASGVHPEAYPVVRKHRSTATRRDIRRADRQRHSSCAALKPERVRRRDASALPTVTDILRELEKPGRDPRPEFRTADVPGGRRERSATSSPAWCWKAW